MQNVDEMGKMREKYELDRKRVNEDAPASI